MRIFLGVLILTALLAASTVPVAAQQGDDISVDVPSSVTAGESTTLTGEVQLEERPGTWETDATVTLEINGEVVSSRDVTVTDGETTTVSFSYTFESEGTYTVRVIGEATFGSYTYSQSAERTVSVDAAASGEETVDVSTPKGDTPSGPAQTIDGAIFPVPQGLRDDVNAYREQTGSLGPRAFVVATESNAYIVFTDQQVKKGVGSVTGQVVSKDAVTVNGITFGAVIETNVDPQTNARGVGLSVLAGSPNEYSLELVKVEAMHSIATVRYQPEAGGGVDSPSTLGVLTEGSGEVRNLTAGASTVVFEANKAPLSEATPRVFTTSTRRGFWADGEMTVTGVVLPPDTTAREVATTFDASGMLSRADGEAVISVTGSTAVAEDVASVSQVVSGEYEGDAVQIEGSVVQTRLSTQELLTQATPCSSTKVPVKEVCVPVPNDVILHTGVVWDLGATDAADALVIVGASSRVQEEIVTARQGQYRMTGRVVSLQQIDGGLPKRRALVVMRLERTGDLERGVPEAMDGLREEVNSSVSVKVSVEASASAEAAADTQRTEEGDGGASGTGTPDGSVGGGPTGKPGPGVGVLAALVALFVIAGGRLIR